MANISSKSLTPRRKATPAQNGYVADILSVCGGYKATEAPQFLRNPFFRAPPRKARANFHVRFSNFFAVRAFRHERAAFDGHFRVHVLRRHVLPGTDIGFIMVNYRKTNAFPPLRSHVLSPAKHIRSAIFSAAGFC
ncbi:MAG TPA: hypothetical protein VGM68_13735 [Rhizomicrobium sp.]